MKNKSIVLTTLACLSALMFSGCIIVDETDGGDVRHTYDSSYYSGGRRPLTKHEKHKLKKEEKKYERRKEEYDRKQWEYQQQKWEYDKQKREYDKAKREQQHHDKHGKHDKHDKHGKHNAPVLLPPKPIAPPKPVTPQPVKPAVQKPKHPQLTKPEPVKHLKKAHDGGLKHQHKDVNSPENAPIFKPKPAGTVKSSLPQAK